MAIVSMQLQEFKILKSGEDIRKELNTYSYYTYCAFPPEKALIAFPLTALN